MNLKRFCSGFGLSCIFFLALCRLAFPFGLSTVIDSVSATSVDNTSIRLDIKAFPAFTAAGELAVEKVSTSGVGSPGTPSFADGTVSVIYDALEPFTLVIKADTSEDGDPTSGYSASTTFSYDPYDQGTGRARMDIDSEGGTLSLTQNGQTAALTVPAGILAEEGTFGIEQILTSRTNTGYSRYVYEFMALNSATGTPLSADEINSMIITLPLELDIIDPGDFRIDLAENLVSLESGRGAALPVDQIISTDYVGDGFTGSVTFEVDHLSVFGVYSNSAADSGTGGGGADGGGGNCFIATAAFGSPLAKYVRILSEFRDRYLIPFKMGKRLVNFYYRHSPPIADYLRGHPVARAVVRYALMPVAGTAYLALKLPVVLVGVCLFLALASVGYAYRRRRC